MKIPKSKSSSKPTEKKAAPAKPVKKIVKSPPSEKTATKKVAEEKVIKKSAPVVKKQSGKTIGTSSGSHKRAKDELDDDLKEFMHDDDDMQPIKKSRKDDLGDDDDFKMEDEFKMEEDLSETFSDDDDDDF